MQIYLLPGTHELSETLYLTPLDNGITWSAKLDNAIISGGRNVTGWAPCAISSSLLCAPITFANAQPRHLFVNGRRAPRSVAPASVTMSFASPISVDSEKYVVSDAAVAGWKVPANVEMAYTSQGSP